MKTQTAVSDQAADDLTHKVVSRDEWLATRRALLVKEKQHTRAGDAIAAERRQLPWVKVEKDYVFDSPQGKVRLADLFQGRSQLAVYHFMFGPEWPEGCKSCSFVVDHLNGSPSHLAARDVTLVAVSGAPLAKLQAFKARMGWQIPWVSSFGSDFNHDFAVTFTPEELESGQKLYNFGTRPPYADENPGMRNFLPRLGRRYLPHLLDLRPRSRTASHVLLHSRQRGEGAGRRCVGIPDGLGAVSRWLQHRCRGDRGTWLLLNQRGGFVNAKHCCRAAGHGSNCVSAPLTRLRRGGRSAGWIVPIATLILMPKCPMCIAAYVAIISGVGISMSAASYLRTGALLACTGSLLWLVARRLRAFPAALRAVPRFIRPVG